jgi:hypothetical protein
LMLTFYIGVLPPALFGVATMAYCAISRSNGAAAPPCSNRSYTPRTHNGGIQRTMLGLGVTALHLGLARLQTGPEEVEEEMEGYEGEFQVLGLS